MVRRLIFLSIIIVALGSVLFLAPVGAQSNPHEGKVLTLSGSDGPYDLPQDTGSMGLWQKLLKLTTTGSVLHTTAHPDDEHGGVLTLLSRGQGVRTSLLTLNRGESGANAIGPELFDGLGLIRTQELLISDRYYGLDDQYFSIVADYGFSKRLEEALDKWGRENVLRDVVRVIRINRPFVILSRFNGSARDGHGNHQTSGLVSQEAWEAAGDPNRFPEQISQEGLRPWKPFKMYRGGIRDGERWNVYLDSSEFSPWLGDTYRQFAALGLSFQRSQTSGVMRDFSGGFGGVRDGRYERLYSRIDAPDVEKDLFDGIDTSLAGIFKILGAAPPEGVFPMLQQAEAEVGRAIAAFNAGNPSATVPFLARGLALVRRAAGMSAAVPDAVFLLNLKEQQFMDAINTALGISIRAEGVPGSTPTEGEGFFRAIPTMGLVVPGQKIRVNAGFQNQGTVAVVPQSMRLESRDGKSVSATGEKPAQLDTGEAWNASFEVEIPQDVTFSSRYFFRDSIRQDSYQVRDPKSIHLPDRKPGWVVAVDYTANGVPVTARQKVWTRQANLPYGYVWREMKAAPAVAVNVKPEMRVVPLGRKQGSMTIEVELVNNQEGGSTGELKLQLPNGWTSRPAAHSFAFSQPGERANYSFAVAIPSLAKQDYMVKAVAVSGGKEYSEGYQVIEHRDLETTYIYRSAQTTVRGIEVTMPALRVGYVMGVGDEVPSGIEQLGASVQLLSSDNLATGNLQQFDAIVVGTRAYAVRPDLITYNQRLLDYAKAGGNLVILYQTQEFIPNKWAAYPAELPPRAEEVSEEDSPVKILASDHKTFSAPNKITLADFDGWVEQRGSKFFSTWDGAYTALIETQDQGQEPQSGGWVTAPFGKGQYTYCAYAFHRQLPYGVEGAYRVFANLLSLTK